MSFYRIAVFKTYAYSVTRVSKKSKTSYTILSVDDDTEMIGLLHEVVSQLGHTRKNGIWRFTFLIHPGHAVRISFENGGSAKRQDVPIVQN